MRLSVGGYKINRMSSAPTLEQRVAILFEMLRQRASRGGFPEHGSFANRLNDQVVRASGAGLDSFKIKPEVTSLFATAAVEMWLRSVHSFLISASLTQASPIWATVSGYYASHYCVRGLAHLLGSFHLFQKKRIILLEITGGNHICHIEKTNEREHRFYWKAVKECERFVDDPFFTLNNDGDEKSDSAHRNVANYYDHIDKFPNFQFLDFLSLKRRIQRISNIELSSIPIPNKNEFPDVEAVQLVAYHRIVRFRTFVDGIVSQRNRFWRVHRNPSWCSDLLDFQVTAPLFVEVYRNK